MKEMLLLNWFIKMFGDLPLLLINVDYIGWLLLWMAALGWPGIMWRKIMVRLVLFFRISTRWYALNFLFPSKSFSQTMVVSIFTQSSLNFFFNENDVVLETACPQTPQQNGVAEWKNCHNLETSQALLIGGSIGFSVLLGQCGYICSVPHESNALPCS